MDLEQKWSEWVWSKVRGFHCEEEFPDAEPLLNKRKEYLNGTLQPLSRDYIGEPSQAYLDNIWANQKVPQ